VVGSVALDRLERDGRVEHRLGGVVTYGGLTAAQLGCAVTAWSAMPPRWAEVARARLLPVALCATAAEEPTRFVNRERPGSEREQRCPSQARPLCWADRPFGDHESWDWVHLGPLHAADLDAGLATPLRARCRMSSLDLQGYTRSVDANHAIVAHIPADLAARLTGLDWVKASEGEWALASAALRVSPAEALQRFAWRGLLVTSGERGGVLYTDAGAMPWLAAPAEVIALETGAGDVFITSFLARMMELGETDGRSPGSTACREALTHAAEIAARHVSGRWLDLEALALPAD